MKKIKRKQISTFLIGAAIITIGILIGKFTGGCIVGAAAFATVSIMVGRWVQTRHENIIQKGIRDYILNGKK